MYLQGTGPSFMERLKPGFRAVAIQVDYWLGGSVTPGTMVDVLFRTHPRAARSGWPAIPETTMSLFEGAEVIHVETRRGAAVGFSQRSEATRLVMLAVTPDQAQMLQAVEGRGQISLAARPNDDTLTFGVVYKEPLTLERLLNLEMREPEERWVTEVYRRKSRTVQAFPSQELSEEAEDDERFAGEPLPPVLPREIPGAPVKVSTSSVIP
jgi:Flp pilus assembly protein CpaB